MITELYVQETTPSPVPFPFHMMGGVHGDVVVSVVDADGAVHTPSTIESRDPDSDLLMQIKVRLDPNWAYPAKVMLDWANTVPNPAGPVRPDEETTT